MSAKQIDALENAIKTSKRLLAQLEPQDSTTFFNRAKQELDAVASQIAVSNHQNYHDPLVGWFISFPVLCAPAGWYLLATEPHKESIRAFLRHSLVVCEQRIMSLTSQ